MVDLPTPCAPSTPTTVNSVESPSSGATSSTVSSKASLSSLRGPRELLEEGPPAGSVLDTFIEPGLILTTTERGGVVTIDLDEDLLAAIDTRNQRRAFAQIVLTFTENLRGVGQVVFTLAGEPLGVPKGNGLFSQPGEPVSGDDYAILLVDAPGIEPEEGEPVTGTTTTTPDG